MSRIHKTTCDVPGCKAVHEEPTGAGRAAPPDAVSLHLSGWIQVQIHNGAQGLARDVCPTHRGPFVEALGLTKADLLTIGVKLDG